MNADGRAPTLPSPGVPGEGAKKSAESVTQPINNRG